ncbi:hypothetical protein [Streptacidiphilus cavernicola]|uniref:Uncharacterized protein n=1 Tax=Streptacidiphilus cavernicola TaxID=3342716 RepID=A0ABV6VY91_9ACTN
MSGDQDGRDIAVAGPWGVRVMSKKCTTCIYRPGNLMHLAPGRLAQITREAIDCEGQVVCHESDGVTPGTGQPAAVCKGFEEHPQSRRSLALRMADALGWTVYVDPR